MSGQCFGNRPYILGLLIPVILMSMAKSYAYLSYLSIPAILIAVTGMICIFVYSFIQLGLGQTSDQPLLYFDMAKVLGRIGLAMYIFDGNAIVLNIRAEAKEKQSYYSLILRRAVISTLALFVIFSTICYSVYREKTTPILTMGLTPLTDLLFFILCCVQFNAITSYPVQILVAFKIIEAFPIFQFREKINSKSFLSRNREIILKLALRSFVIVLTTIITLSVKTFTDYINIAGAIGSVTIAFVVPELLYLRVYGSTITNLQRIACYSIGIFGIIGSTYSISYSVSKMMNNDLS